MSVQILPRTGAVEPLQSSDPAYLAAFSSLSATADPVLLLRHSGSCQSSGTPDKTTASPAAFIVEDEAARIDDTLFYSVKPMLAASGGQLILMSTPFGKRRHFFEAWQDDGAEWERVEIPATA
jgi:hypothetical protein